MLSRGHWLESLRFYDDDEIHFDECGVKIKGIPTSLLGIMCILNVQHARASGIRFDSGQHREPSTVNILS